MSAGAPQVRAEVKDGCVRRLLVDGVDVAHRATEVVIRQCGGGPAEVTVTFAAVEIAPVAELRQVRDGIRLPGGERGE